MHSEKAAVTDPTDAELHTAALERFTRGPIHLPPEITDSMSLYDMGEAGLLDDIPEVHPDVARHYAESATADAVESITDKLTREYLRPMLEAHGVPNPEEHRLQWCSPSENLAPLIDQWGTAEAGPLHLSAVRRWRCHFGFARWCARPALDGRYRQRQRNRRRRRR